MAIIEFTGRHTFPYTNNGITWNESPAHYFNANGTSTATQSRINLYDSYTMPSWFDFDSTYQLKINRTGSTEKVAFQIQLQTQDGTWLMPLRSLTDTQFSIPSVEEGYKEFVVRLRSAPNVGSIDETVHPTLEKIVPYIPRLNSQGIEGDPHYESRNPFYLSGWGMPNCTAYAFGRSWEIADPDNQYINYPPLSTGNADSWYNHADNWPRGSTPALGAIACYSGGIYSGDGHVCVVEEIDTANNRCRVSESAYNGYYFRATHFIGMDGSYGYGGYHFDGFIYNPYAGNSPEPGPGPIQGFDIWKFKPLIYKKKGKYLT